MTGVSSLKGRGEMEINQQYLVEVSRSANWGRERLLYLPHVLRLLVRLFNGALDVVDAPAQEMPRTSVRQNQQKQRTSWVSLPSGGAQAQQQKTAEI
jgi:hypothetical protein